jgi:hypothetical protein
MSELEKKCIIIGAGPAGLTAAYELLKSPSAHVHPVIYEASEEIGGISKTVEYKGNRIDIGGHRFFTKNEDVMALWHEVMPAQGAPSKDDILLKRDVPLSPNGPDPEKTDRVMLSRHRISRIFYLHKFFDYPISIKLQTFKNMGVVRTWKAGWGYLGSCLHKRKETSLADFYMNRFGKPLYKMFFEDYTEKVWGRDPSQIAPDWGSQRVKGLSLWKTFTNALAKPFRKKSKNVETSLIEQFDYPKKGPGQLYEEMASLIKEMGGEIHLGSEVTKLNLPGWESRLDRDQWERRGGRGLLHFLDAAQRSLFRLRQGKCPCRTFRSGDPFGLSRFHHGRTVGQEVAHSEQNQKQDGFEHPSGHLDLHSGTGSQTRPASGLQQLVSLYGEGS